MALNLKKRMKRYMLRPMLYMTLTRFLLALTAALLWNHFLNASALPMRAYACLFLGVFFAALTWIAYLRLDGVKLPKLMMHRVNIRKKPTRAYGDMADYTDEPVISFDELEDAEKDVCCLAADAFCCLVFVILSCL